MTQFCISFSQHKLKVVSSDGNKMVPVMASSVIVHSGERYDIIVEADQPVDNYWIRAETLNALRGNPPDVSISFLNLTIKRLEGSFN